VSEVTEETAMPAIEEVQQEAAFYEGVSDKVDHEVTGLTVGDGFRFGCGFVLSMTIGILALLIVLTAFVAVGALLGIKIPILG
jgi:hypothetical protein